MKRERDIGEYFSGGKKMKLETTTKVSIEYEKETAEAEAEAEPISPFKRKFQDKLNKEEKELLSLEIETMEDSWFEALADVFTQDWFLELKRFVREEFAKHTVYPPREEIYSWSQLTPLKEVRCIIIGQDPYHGPGQAHGLAFSVKGNTKIPPSLRNIYKGVKVDYPSFVIPTHGDLTEWAKQGVLLLNTVLTVRAGNANSHAGHGWEHFTREVLSRAVHASTADATHSVVVVAWGKHAERVTGQVMAAAAAAGAAAGAAGAADANIISTDHVHVLRGCHPSPLSAHRGFFEQGHFRRTNELLGERAIDWCRCG